MSTCREQAIAATVVEMIWPELEPLVEAKIGEKLRLVALAQPDPWMTTREAAAYLRLDPEALAARARRGTVPAHKDGTRWMFRRDEVDHVVTSPGDRGASLRRS